MSNYENLMMVQIDVDKYEGRKADKNAARSLDIEKNVHGKGYSASKMACDAEEMSGYLQPYNRLMVWFNDIRNALHPGGNIYLVHVDKYQEAVQEVDKFKVAFWNGVDTFVSNWDEIVEKQKYRLNDAWNYTDYPARIEKKFACKILFSAMPQSSALRNYVGLPSEDVEKLIEENEKALSSMYESTLKGPYKRITDLVGHMASKLTDEGARFKNSLVENIREIAELIPKLNITNNKEMKDLGERLLDELVVDPDVLRYDLGKRKEVAEKAERVMADLEGYF